MVRWYGQSCSETGCGDNATDHRDFISHSTASLYMKYCFVNKIEDESHFQLLLKVNTLNLSDYLLWPSLVHPRSVNHSCTMLQNLIQLFSRICLDEWKQITNKLCMNDFEHVNYLCWFQSTEFCMLNTTVYRSKFTCIVETYFVHYWYIHTCSMFQDTLQTVHS